MSLPAGLEWRPEFAPQHADGKEKPSARSTTPVAGPNATDVKTSTGEPQKGQADTGSATGCMDPQMMLMLGAMFLVLYFFMIRPGQKQEKALKEMRSTLQLGDRVVTSSGMHGTILSVDEKAKTVTLKTDEEGRVKMTFDQTAVSRKVTDDSEAPKT